MAAGYADGLTSIIYFRLLFGSAILYLLYRSHLIWPQTIKQTTLTFQRATIEALAIAINAKDQITADHVRRVQVYAEEVGRLFKCSELELRALREGALLHDIGKIAVPDSILTKRDKLTRDEFEKMKLHPVIGAAIVARLNLPYPIVPVIRSHHERWDGYGYPDALKGEEIPITARILSVVDCFDAVREDRPYRTGMSRQEAIDLIMRDSGKRYDPRVVGEFLTHLPKFEALIEAGRPSAPADYGIEPIEELTERAHAALPGTGLADDAGCMTYVQ